MTSTPINTFQVNPDLKDVLSMLKKDIFMSFNCHGLATIESFDATKQTASASMNYTKTYLKKSEDPSLKKYGLYESVYVDYPVMLDCPVIVLGGGNAHLTMPITKGDQCLVLFNDRSIDDWFASGQKTNLTITRSHSFADGLLLVGLHSLKNQIQNYDTVRAVLKNKKAAVGVRGDSNKVLITNDYPSNSVTLYSVLNNLITHIKALVTATSAITVTNVTAGGGNSGPPLNSAVITAIGAQLTADATALQGLLE